MQQVSDVGRANRVMGMWRANEEYIMQDDRWLAPSSLGLLPVVAKKLLTQVPYARYKNNQMKNREGNYKNNPNFEIIG